MQSFTLLVLLGWLSFVVASPFKSDPIPHPDSVFVHGRMRISVLRPAVIRLEYSSSGEFDDSPTVAFLNRRFDAVSSLTHELVGTKLTLRTSHVELVCDSSQEAAGGGSRPRPSRRACSSTPSRSGTRWRMMQAICMAPSAR